MTDDADAPVPAAPAPGDGAAEIPAASGAAPVGPAGPAGPAAGGPAVTPTRASAAWTSIAAAVTLGVLLVIFLLQNMTRARVNFLFLHARLPIAVALLIATLVGAGVTLLVGAIRIRQLRHRISHR